MLTKIIDVIQKAKSQILASQDYSDSEKVKALFQLLTSTIEEITDQEKIVFTTLFARMSFLGTKYSVNSELLFYLHSFRRDNEHSKLQAPPKAYIELGAYLIDSVLAIVNDSFKNQASLSSETKQIFQHHREDKIGFKTVVDAVIFDMDVDQKLLYFYDNDDASTLKIASLDEKDKNENFNSIFELINVYLQLPLPINFIDVEIYKDGKYIPHAVVIQPDFLLDVTAIASCYNFKGSESRIRLVKMFQSIDHSLPLIKGNIANLFLDEIIAKPDIHFNELLPKVFKLDPLSLSACDDGDIRKLIQDIKSHYLNLKRAIAKDFRKADINTDNSFLEPSFYSRDFGIQGRLDMFHVKDVEKKKYDIVELKSGKIFQPNAYGLNAPHYVQTLLYDLIIKSTMGYKSELSNYILYSSEGQNALKYAVPARPLQYDALRIRNELIAYQYYIAENEENVFSLFSELTPDQLKNVFGFEKRDLEVFTKVYQRLTGIYLDYFNSFVSFIAREQNLAKTGEHGINKSNGLAALWLENNDEKEERFSILYQMTIKEDRSENEVPSLIMERSTLTNELANFRIGDIAVLYPSQNTSRAVLRNQIFKCSITDITADHIELRLRSKQYNHSVFNEFKYWNIEPDSLDSGFSSLYRGIYAFMGYSKDTLDLWLGLRPPNKTIVRERESLPNLTAEQNEVLSRMISAEDYFLLWGPPGTGKTSVMIRSLVAKIFSETEENILLLAYTNRAVDEICEALSSIAPQFEENIILVGSATSTSPKYRSRVLKNLLEGRTRRDEIQTMLKGCRIYVSTVSSIVNRKSLFLLKQFDRVIIDEASQILEPMIIGLLAKIKKVIMIGDHKQLPAVVAQSEERSKVKSESMLAAGISDMRMSLFERLYHQCMQYNWQHALGILSHQGRMHPDLMRFPNEVFYENRLKALNSDIGKGPHFENGNEEEEVIINNRFLYIPTPVDTSFNWKTNQYESLQVMKLIRLIVDLYEKNNISFTPQTIGIITPYRAQIATIKNDLLQSMPEIVDSITIDTVERFQGGARDIIILSLCTNQMSQLQSLVSLSKEGVDRKLNVAMTRAKQRLIVLGNESILKQDATYSTLMNSACTWKKEA